MSVRRIVPRRRHGRVANAERRLVHAVDAQQPHFADAFDDDGVAARDFGDLLRARGHGHEQRETRDDAPERRASTHAASVDDRPGRAAVIVPERDPGLSSLVPCAALILVCP